MNNSLQRYAHKVKWTFIVTLFTQNSQWKCVFIVKSVVKCLNCYISEIPLLLISQFINQVDMLVYRYFISLLNSIYCIAFSCSNTLTFRMRKTLGERCSSLIKQQYWLWFWKIVIQNKKSYNLLSQYIPCAVYRFPFFLLIWPTWVTGFNNHLPFFLPLKICQGMEIETIVEWQTHNTVTWTSSHFI